MFVKILHKRNTNNREAVEVYLTNKDNNVFFRYLQHRCNYFYLSLFTDVWPLRGLFNLSSVYDFL